MSEIDWNVCCLTSVSSVVDPKVQDVCRFLTEHFCVWEETRTHFLPTVKGRGDLLTQTFSINCYAPLHPHWLCSGSATAFGWWMGIISLIVHTWGGVDKSHAVCPQRELAFPPCFRGWWTPCVWCWCFADTILATTFKLYRNKYFIFIQLCGLSPIYVAAQEPGRNNILYYI